MQAIAFYLLKMMICSGLLLLYYWIALRNKQFHYYNRFYLLMTIAASVFIPLLQLKWFTFQSNNEKAIALMNSFYMDENIVAINKTPTINWGWIAGTICIIISISMLSFLIFRISKIYRIKQHYPLSKMNDFDFINTDLAQAPFSFLNNLFWRNDIELNESTGQQILQHELTHIHQKHTWDKLLMQTWLSLFWMNPFYWLMQRELYLIHEFIADEKAVENKDASAFATMLLKSQYGNSIFLPAQSFNYSPIKRRLLMLTTSQQPKFHYARRLMVLPLLGLVVFLFAFRMQKKEDNLKSTEEISYQKLSENKTGSDTSELPKNLLYVIEGKISEEAVLKALDPNKIESVNVLKETSAIDKYGEKGKNGVIEINLKKDTIGVQTPLKNINSNQVVSVNINKNESAIKTNAEKEEIRAIGITTRGESKSVSPGVLYVVDGVIAEGISGIDQNTIRKVEVLKDETATSIYGEKGKNGVVLITTKADEHSAEKTLNSTVTITQQSPAHFPGGKDAWLKFLQTNLKTDVPVKNGGAPGKYTVILSFIVDADGSLSEIKADNDPGFGTAKEAVRLMETSPKWIPAVKEGKNISSLTKQSITFVITEG